MDILAHFSEIAPFVLALVGAGGVAGFLAGVFGIGGGAILVPVFYQMLGILGFDDAIRMHLSVGTSLAIIVPTSIRSFRAHYLKGAVDMDLLRSFLWVVPAGVVAASIVTAHISGAGLRGIFAFVALVVGSKLLFAKSHWKLADDIPGNPVRGIIGFLIGFFSTFMGIGGGVMNNTFMTLFGRPMHQAVATSSGTGVLISIPGVIGYVWAGWGTGGMPPFTIGYVNLLALAILIPVTLFAAPLGVRVAHALSRRQLEVAFGLFMFFVAIRFLISLL
ncbi:MAG: sulfite exporter TauE/SafE family protein [Nitratireductor sp.]|nr:sulfite exporter TauE/SafE family protein [Nitratireductor sp.]MCB1458732.1 sulfite exporter TauE/SafE family protein [Nitratireductor sp.]